MEFNFDITTTRNCILKTEELLRDFVSAILTREYGISWEDDPNIGWSQTKIKELEGRRESKMNLFPHQTHSPRFIDYSYVSDIKYLIFKNPNLFKCIVKEWNSTMFKFDLLNIHRNDIMHREKSVLPHQHHLCLGLCGELMLMVEHWKHGYSRQILSYACDIHLIEPEGTDAAAANQKTLSDALACLQSIRTLAIDRTKMQGHNNEEVEIVTTSRGEVSVSKPMPMGYAYPSGRYQAANIHLTSKSLDALELVLRKIDKKYWTFK